MLRYVTLLMGLVLVLAAFTGCSDESTGPNQTTGQPGVFGGEIGDADFEITLLRAVGEDNPIPGPFVLRGYDVEYKDGATQVKLTVKSKGDFPLYEPVCVTFIDIEPEDVELANPDKNGEDGPTLCFIFAGDDGMWNPGEESLPRLARFEGDPGEAIRFIARLDASALPPGGSIGGVVFNDSDKNGEMDPDEKGIGGVRIMLDMGEAPPDTLPPDTMMTAAVAMDVTETADDGSYRFDGLEAGFYTVRRELDPDCEGTTDPVQFVILSADTSGDVGSFLNANFGCAVVTPPEPPEFLEGDYVAVNGKWDGDYLIAWGIDHFECNGEEPPDTGIVEPPDTMPDPMGEGWDNHDDGDCDDWDRWVCMTRHGKIRGPVTAVYTEDDSARVDTTDTAMMVEIMGTKLKVMCWDHEYDHSDDDGDRNDWKHCLKDIKVGDRIDARVKYTEEGWVAWRLKEWRGNKEQVHGFVEEVMGNGMFKLRVFDTWVVVSDDLCYDHDCEDKPRD